MDRLTVVLLAAAVEGGLVAVALLLGWWLDQPPLRMFRWEARAALEGVAATVALLVLFLAMMRWPIGPLAGIKKFSEEVIRPFLAPCTIVDLVGIAVLAGLGEEMLFRGVLQPVFGRRFGPWQGLAAASVLFGAVHAISVTYAVLATLMGALLGGILMYRQNLLTPVVVHGLYDLVVLLFLLRGPGSARTIGAEAPDPGGDERPSVGA
jgi:membrane protease YdiL (CAAX protease family)